MKNKQVVALQRRVKKLEENYLGLIALIKLSLDAMSSRIELKGPNSRARK